MDKNLLYSVKEVRQLEQMAVSKLQLHEFELMERAGAAAMKLLRETWPAARNLVIYCGKGNNGGDGYVLARLAKQQKLNVQVRYLGNITELSAIASRAANACKQAGIEIKPFVDNEKLTADVVIDAFLGIGLSGDVQGEYKAAIAQINQYSVPIFALDVPSGINADTGSILGAAIKATMTLTFIGNKRGLVTGDALTYVGNLIVDDLGLSHTFYETVITKTDIILNDEIKSALPKRQRNAHKGDFGHVLVIGGNYGMGGAAHMAAEAAARVGAGLVSIATRPEHVFAITSARPEIMCHGINNSVELNSLLAKATVIVLGPGLGQDNWAQELLQLVLKTNQLKVMDADALNLIAKQKSQDFNDNRWILTPHPGEAARLLNTSVNAIQGDRFTAAKQLQHYYGGICVLKGAGTLVCADDDSIGVCTAGNPGMASGGMGDVLSGIIAGLLAQNLSLKQAARVGVLIHALAGDSAAQAQGERGLLAMDLVAKLRDFVN